MKPSNFFVGVDLHLKTSQITIMDKLGNNQQKVKLFNNKPDIAAFFNQLPRTSSIAIEATYNWPWLIEL